MNNESIYITSFKQYISKISDEILFMKIPDSPRFANDKSRFTPIKYIDVFLAIKDHIVAIEFKYLKLGIRKNKDGINIFELLRDIQIETLSKLTSLNIKTFVNIKTDDEKCYLVPYTIISDNKELINYQILNNYLIRNENKKWNKDLITNLIWS